ncbi:MAG: DEAD/DEAH box helicase, partial [Romboutsia sp.]
PLSRAMYHGYIKSLQNIVYTPDEVKLTIDNDDSKLYTIDEIFNMGLRDQDWVTRSVAFSEECSLKVVDASIEELNKKTSNSNIPHKIIAIACSIKHAKQIAKLYESRNIKTAVIYSDLPIEEKNAIFKDIENHRVQAVINVAMLGEGYDHKYLSIAAIFRPFRAELPYTQFIGRVLRYIPEGNPEDNIAKIVSHHYLYLDKLWEKYKKEISQSEIIKSLRDIDDILDKDLDETKGSNPTKTREQQILGNVTESETYHLNVEDYLDTELIRKSKEEEKQFNERIKKLQTLLGISFEQARGIIYQTKTKSNLGRPDKIYKRKKKDLDETIREEIVPNLITKYNIDSESDDLKYCGLFTGPYWYIPNSAGKNSGMIAMYFNAYLKRKIGRPRKNWTDNDLNIAFSYLDKLTTMVEGIIKKYYNL